MYAEVAAELRDVSVEEIAEQTTKNAFGAFPQNFRRSAPSKKYREKIYRLIFLINIKNQSCDNPQQPIKRIYKSGQNSSDRGGTGQGRRRLFRS